MRGLARQMVGHKKTTDSQEIKRNNNKKSQFRLPRPQYKSQYDIMSAYGEGVSWVGERKQNGYDNIFLIIICA